MIRTIGFLGCFLMMATAALPARLFDDIPGDGVLGNDNAGVISVYPSGPDLLDPQMDPAPWDLLLSIGGADHVLQFSGNENNDGPLGFNALPQKLHTTGHILNLTYANNTGQAWSGLWLNLELDPGTPSDQNDALSFSRGKEVGGHQDCSIFTIELCVFDEYDLMITPTSSDFAAMVFGFGDSTGDYIHFTNGMILPGQSATVSFAITNQTMNGLPNNPFYLRATPTLGAVPEPSTVVLMAGGLLGLSVAARRSRKR